MNPWPQLLAIGQTKVLRAFQEAARREPTFDWVSVLTVLGMLALLLSVGYLFHRRRHAPPLRDPGKLFKAALAELELTADDRRLLRAIARHSELGQPAAMLLSPIIMARVANQWACKQPSASYRETTLNRLDALSRRLFNEPLSTPEPIRAGQPNGSA